MGLCGPPRMVASDACGPGKTDPLPTWQSGCAVAASRSGSSSIALSAPCSTDRRRAHCTKSGTSTETHRTTCHPIWHGGLTPRTWGTWWPTVDKDQPTTLIGCLEDRTTPCAYDLSWFDGENVAPRRSSPRIRFALSGHGPTSETLHWRGNTASRSNSFTGSRSVFAGSTWSNEDG